MESVGGIPATGSPKGRGSNPGCANSQLREFGQLSPPLSPRVFISEVTERMLSQGSRGSAFASDTGVSVPGPLHPHSQSWPNDTLDHPSGSRREGSLCLSASGPLHLRGKVDGPSRGLTLPFLGADTCGEHPTGPSDPVLCDPQALSSWGCAAGAQKRRAWDDHG